MELLNRPMPLCPAPISRNVTSFACLNRRGMAVTLFLSGMCRETNQYTLAEEFVKFGEISDVKIVTYPHSGRSTGFGFVMFDDDEGAEAARKAMDGKYLDGCRLSVSVATKGQQSFAKSIGPGNAFGRGPILEGIIDLDRQS